MKTNITWRQWGGTVGVGSRDIFIRCTKCKLHLSLGRTHRKLSRLESGREPQSRTSPLDCERNPEFNFLAQKHAIKVMEISTSRSPVEFISYFDIRGSFPALNAALEAELPILVRQGSLSQPSVMYDSGAQLPCITDNMDERPSDNMDDCGPDTTEEASVIDLSLS